MLTDSCHLKYSTLCHKVDINKKTINVLIYKDVDGDWFLEVVDGLGNSIICDDTFKTDEQALNYSNQMIEAISKLERSF